MNESNLLCIEIDHHRFVAFQNSLLKVVLILNREDLVQSGGRSKCACERLGRSRAFQQISWCTQHFDQFNCLFTEFTKTLNRLIFFLFWMVITLLDDFQPSREAGYLRRESLNVCMKKNLTRFSRLFGLIRTVFFCDSKLWWKIRNKIKIQSWPHLVNWQGDHPVDNSKTEKNKKC